MTAPTPVTPSTPAAPSSGVSWGSLAVTATSVAAAAVAVLWPGHAVPASVQDTLVGVAGMLTALHIHVPKILGKL